MAITIEVGNSTSKIIGLPSWPFNKLRAVLSYSIEAQARYFSGNFNTKSYCIDKAGVFNSGLLPRVIKFLNQIKVTYAVSDLRLLSILKMDKVRHSADLMSLGIKPYPDQIDAALAVLKHHRGIISMPTGSGKSLVIALIVEHLKLKTLIVVPSLQIKEQLTKSLSEIFDDMSNITIENIDSKALKTATDYDLLIIDESHHVAAKTYQKLNRTAWKGIYYRVFLTATPFRNQTEETMLFEGIAGEVIFKLSYKDAVKRGYVVPLEAYYIEMGKIETEAYTWAQVYSELVVNDKYRNEKIAQLLQSLALAKISTLCLVKEIKHGENIQKASLEEPFANGQDETTRQYIDMFNNKKINVLIGTTGILGEGVDTKPCEYVIIAGLGKAKSAFMQQVGRAIRTYPGKESGKVILILDRSHKFLLRHYKEQCKVLKEEYGIIPIKLEL